MDRIRTVEQSRKKKTMKTSYIHEESFRSRSAQSSTARYRLRAGDLIRFAGQPCRVLRVNDCAAVVAVTQAPREFTTLFGVRVRIQPKPALARISPNSPLEILNR